MLRIGFFVGSFHGQNTMHGTVAVLNMLKTRYNQSTER